MIKFSIYLAASLVPVCGMSALADDDFYISAFGGVSLNAEQDFVLVNPFVIVDPTSFAREVDPGSWANDVFPIKRARYLVVPSVNGLNLIL